MLRLRELSTERQSAWIDVLFGKLSRTYGWTFAALWDGIPVGDVKAEWIASLASYTGAQIAWAIEACKANCCAAPTLPRFLQFCQQAPRPEAPKALADKGTPAPPGTRERFSDVIRSFKGGGNGDWAVAVLARIGAGEVLPDLCERNAVEALTALGQIDLAPKEYIALRRSGTE